MKNFIRSAFATLFVLASIYAASAQNNVPTLSLSIPRQGEAGAPANGAQNLTAGGVNGILLRERIQTWTSVDPPFQTGSIRIQRTNTGTTAATRTDFPIAYSLEYVTVPGTERNFQAATSGTLLLLRNATRLPNTSATIQELPHRVNTTPSPVFTPPLPPARPVAVNSLQGDLSPSATLTGRLPVPLNVGTSSLQMDRDANEILLTFTARWSDQRYLPRNPGLQGLRAAIIRLLPSPNNPPDYIVATGAQSDSAFVFLLDPSPTPPMITNALPDIFMIRPFGGSSNDHYIELESPQWRPDAVPGDVFYDDNYDIITYTANTSDPTRVAVRVLPSSSFAPQRPLLIVSVQPDAAINTQVVVSVRALDGSIQDDSARRLATDEFNVYIRGIFPSPTSPTSVANTKQNELPSIATSPNPVTEKCTVSAIIPDAGFFTLRLTDVLGNILYSTSIQGSRGQEQSHQIDMTSFSAGTYFVEVNDGKATSTKKIVKM